MDSRSASGFARSVNRVQFPNSQVWVGHWQEFLHWLNFDVGFAAAYSDPAALGPALPRLKMATVRDCKWTKGPDGSQTLTQCPLGEGMVDWPQFFGTLAKAKFIGPITLRVEYAPQDELAAVRKDLAFLKKQRAAAYGG